MFTGIVFQPIMPIITNEKKTMFLALRIVGTSTAPKTVGLITPTVLTIMYLPAYRAKIATAIKVNFNTLNVVSFDQNKNIGNKAIVEK